MKTSKRGIEFIAGFEGFRAKAYKPVAAEEHYTIGYGHYGPDVKQGQVITHAEGLALLARDVVVAERAVNATISKLRWKYTQHAFDALVSFVFNCGPGVLEATRSLGKALRRGHRAVPGAMALYVKDAAGRTLAGLVRRRKAEGDLFLERESPAEWLTAAELKRVRQLDALRKKPRPTPADRELIRDLVESLTAQRKRIWRSAQSRAKGGDGRGWEYRDRRRRYTSLLTRTA